MNSNQRWCWSYWSVVGCWPRAMGLIPSIVRRGCAKQLEETKDLTEQVPAGNPDGRGLCPTSS